MPIMEAWTAALKRGIPETEGVSTLQRAVQSSDIQAILKCINSGARNSLAMVTQSSTQVNWSYFSTG